MRTEIRGVPLGLLQGRLDYNLDVNGSHAAAGKPAAVEWVNVAGSREFMSVASGGGAFRQRKSRRGATKKYAAFEITAHAKDKAGSIMCLTRPEMRIIFHTLMIQFGAVYGLAAMHGLSDGHFVLVNRTVRGMALRSTFPNNATPRRVMVAICDRLERAFNRERARTGDPLLKLMLEVREEIDGKHGRKSMHDQIAQHLLVESGSANSVDDIIKAMHALGWSAARLKTKVVAVRFTEVKPTKKYEIDLLLRGVAKAYERLKVRLLEQENGKQGEKAYGQKARKASPRDKLPRKVLIGAEAANPLPQDATPADVTRWAERIATLTKTPKPSGQEIVDALKHPIGGFLHLENSSAHVVIRDLGGNSLLRIPMADLSAAVTAVISRGKEGDSPKTPNHGPGLGR